MSKTLPTWHCEALDQGLDYVVLVFNHTAGLVFAPAHLKQPFRVGGGYDGNWPVDAQGALEHIRDDLPKSHRESCSWFIPFVQKVHDQQDFSLHDMGLDKRAVRLIRGPWPW
ncbi:hypothetical protein ACFODZ_00635 [Marinicella sediminis]|uniref:Uncharacterized protein n=1 Tax=Marinicella sediminis TaxID=1792834 RepID=A0ABV7J7V7_9GAMM|nr:hypothetical protein [Marinicella sediminis]